MRLPSRRIYLCRYFFNRKIFLAHFVKIQCRHFRCHIRALFSFLLHTQHNTHTHTHREYWFWTHFVSRSVFLPLKRLPPLKLSPARSFNGGSRFSGRKTDLATKCARTSTLYVCPLLRKSINLDSVWVGDSRTYQLSFLLQVVARLQMRYNRVLGAGIPANAYLIL